METTYREHMYASGEWECGHVDRNMVQIAQSSYKQKGKLTIWHCEAAVKEDGDHENNNCQNRPWDLYLAYLLEPGMICS
jgi:hypothetical protein